MPFATITHDKREGFTDFLEPLREAVNDQIGIQGTVVDKRGPDQGATEHIHMLARKYMGRDEYPLLEGENRVILRIKPTHVFEHGTDGERAGRWS